MRFFLRTVVGGFAFSLGAALFKKVQDHIGLGEDKARKGEDSAHPQPREGAPDPEGQIV